MGLVLLRNIDIAIHCKKEKNMRFPNEDLQLYNIWHDYAVTIFPQKSCFTDG